MYDKPTFTIAILPDDSVLEVSYFCTDKKLKDTEKEIFTELIVQLHDCFCAYKINRALLNDAALLESIVQKMVVNAKGHLC